MSRRALLFVGSFLILGLLAEAQAPKPAQRLSPRDLQSIELVAQSYYRNDMPTVVESLSRLVGPGNEERVGLINQELARRHVPDTATLLTETRLAYVQQGLAKQLPKPSAHETLIVLDTLRDRINQTIERKQSVLSLIGLFVLAPTADAYGDALWKLHVLRNQLDTSRLHADYMTRLAKNFPRADVSRLSDSQRDLIVSGRREVMQELDGAAGDVEERDIELRIARLRAACARLEDATLDRERFQAAYVLHVDGRIVTAFLEQVKNGKRICKSDLLTDPNTYDSVTRAVTRARELAGDLPAKAALLYDGLHWWMRGRYGAGPEAEGLAKSPAAMTLLAAQFGLFMPEEIPKPTNPDQAPRVSVPTYDRRHHYWWAWEDRRLRHGGLSLSSTTTSPKDRFTVTLSQFW